MSVILDRFLFIFLMPRPGMEANLAYLAWGNPVGYFKEL